MFGIGTWEIVVVLLIVLLLFGPKKLPELARSLGRSFHELKRSVDGVREEFERGADEPNDSSQSLPEQPEKKDNTR